MKTESAFIASAIDAKEGKDMATLEFPNLFVQIWGVVRGCTASNNILRSSNKSNDGRNHQQQEEEWEGVLLEFK